MNWRRLMTVLLLAAAIWLLADAAVACPTCKDQLAHDPEAANIARGYFYSILFMLSMPFLILTGLGSYFYWEVCRARTQLAAGAADPSQAPSRWDNRPAVGQFPQGLASGVR